MNVPTPLPSRNVSLTLDPKVGTARVIAGHGTTNQTFSRAAGATALSLTVEIRAGDAVLLQRSESPASGSEGDNAAVVAAAGEAQRWRFVSESVQLYYDYYDLQKEPTIERSGMGVERPSGANTQHDFTLCRSLPAASPCLVVIGQSPGYE